MSIQQPFTIHKEALFDKKSPRASKEWVRGKLRKIDHLECSFTAVCSGMPQDIRVGEHFRFDIAIQPAYNVTADEFDDKIVLGYCVFTLTAQTQGHSPGTAEFEILRQKKNTQKPQGPFSRESGYRKTVDLGVLSHLPATFHGHDANPSYNVRLEIRLNVANKPGASNPVDINYHCGLVMHPQAVQPVKQRQMDNLPTYEEVMAG